MTNRRYRKKPKMGPKEERVLRVIKAADTGGIGGLGSFEVGKVYSEHWGRMSVSGAGVTLSHLRRRGYVREARVYDPIPTHITPEGVAHYRHLKVWHLEKAGKYAVRKAA
jgi:hypothetical protein